ncbi:MAG: GDSL-type esterase/lipase family protein [Polyangiaceae bacterium]
MKDASFARVLFVTIGLASCTGPRGAETTTARTEASSTVTPMSSASSTSESPSVSEPIASTTPSASAALPPLPPASSASNPNGKKKYLVAAMGDSLTDAKSHGGKFLDYLRNKCPQSTFDNYGKGGQMVNQMRKRFAHDVLGEGVDAADAPPKYTHVIVFGGVNDLCSDKTAKRTVPKIERDLSEMYRMAHEHQMKVVGITVTPWGGFTKFYEPSRAATTKQLNAWLRKGPSRGEIDTVIDGYALLSCDDPEKLCAEFVPPFKDGLHFNKMAHDKLGEALFQAVFSDCL